MRRVMVIVGLIVLPLVAEAQQVTPSQSAAPAPAALPSPVARPVPVATPQPGGAPVSSAAAEHLLKAAEHLEAAGLKDQAAKLREQAKRSHDAIEIEVKLAEVARLQAEIRKLRKVVGGGEQQVLTHLRMIELSRTAMKEQGIDIGSQSVLEKLDGENRPNGSMHLSLLDQKHDLLKQLDAWCKRDKPLGRVLAEPTIVTLPGRPAYFTAGGEFPVPVPRKDGTGATVEYRNYGTSVQLSPTMLDDGRVRLEIRPRVTELDDSRTIQVGEQRVPGLRVKELDVVVDIAPNQVAVIGGLVQSQIEKVPSPKPLGKSQDRVNETEMIVLIRVELVSPEALPTAQLPRPAPAK